MDQKYITMKIIFLGTASCYPTPTRGVSCTALQLDDGQVWLFDCGEGSQIQLQKCKHLRGGKITKIFITHLHGDHVFGLPGLLCTIGMGGNPDEKQRIVDIYGPHGLRKYLLTCLEMSSSAPAFQFNIHELMPQLNEFPVDASSSNPTFEYLGDAAEYIGESSHRRIYPQTLEHGTNQDAHSTETLKSMTAAESSDLCLSTETSYSQSKYYWDILTWNEGTHSVKAAALQHRIPCFGYVVHEKDKPGALNVEKLKELGVKPGPIYSQIKLGIPTQLENGDTIEPKAFLGPPKRGRKVTILGDTKDSSEMIPICRDSDLIIHEATNDNSLKIQAVERGHSTPDMAAQFAIDANTGLLCLTHVSPRYRPSANDAIEEDVSKDKLSEHSLFADRLKDEAIDYLSKAKAHIEVLVAEDFMVVPVQAS